MFTKKELEDFKEDIEREKPTLADGARTVESLCELIERLIAELESRG